MTAVRKAQKAFYENTQDELNQSGSFVVFGIEGLIMDIGANTRVSNGFKRERAPWADLNLHSLTRDANQKCQIFR